MSAAVRAWKLCRATGLQIDLTNKTAKDFLLGYPRGAYTTGRTVNITNLVQYDSHMDRICASLSLMKFGDDEVESSDIAASLAPFRSRATMEPLVLPILRAALNHYHSHVGRVETRITLLVAWDSAERDVILASHVSDLPDQLLTQVLCDVLGTPRRLASAKDSQWLRDRAALEERKSPDAGEVVLIEDGDIYEGLTSNFFAISKDGVILTAPEGAILQGTVQALVLERCAKLGIPVKREHPRLAEAGSWRGAFLTSTSRIVLPVTKLRPEGSETISLPIDPLMDQIRVDIVKHIADHSRPLL